MSTRFTRVTVALAALIVVAGCGAGAGSPSAPASEAASAPASASAEPSAAASQTAVELTLAHSYQDAQPQHACGAQVIADEVAARHGGLAVDDLRRQPARRRRRPHRVGRGRRHRHGHPGRVRPERAVRTDGRRRWRLRLRRRRSPAIASSRTRPRTPLKDGFLAATGVRILGAWSAGARQFTANKPIRTPDDLAGSADALPAVPAVPHERRGDGRRAGRGRLRGALPGAPAGHRRRPGEPHQQHRRQQHPGSPGRHQPVQPPAELQPRRHQRGEVAVAEPRAAGGLRRRSRRPWLEVPQCVEEFETTTLEDWRANGTIEIVEDVDREAFQTKAEAVPPRELHAGAGPGPRGDPLGRRSSRTAAPAIDRVAGAGSLGAATPPLAWGPRRLPTRRGTVVPTMAQDGSARPRTRPSRTDPPELEPTHAVTGASGGLGADTQAELLPPREPLAHDPPRHRPRRAGHRDVAHRRDPRPGPRPGRPALPAGAAGRGRARSPASPSSGARSSCRATSWRIDRHIAIQVVDSSCRHERSASSSSWSTSSSRRPASPWPTPSYDLIADDIGQRTPAAEIPLAWIYVVPLVGFLLTALRAVLGDRRCSTSRRSRGRAGARGVSLALLLAPASSACSCCGCRWPSRSSGPCLLYLVGEGYSLGLAVRLVDRRHRQLAAAGGAAVHPRRDHRRRGRRSPIGSTTPRCCCSGRSAPASPTSTSASASGSRG